jgi:type IV secretory pathway VirB10-like protein
MGVTELSNALGINKSVVSRLVSKGMPTTSTQAAQAWREIYAKPRAKRGQAGTPPPEPKAVKPRKSAQFPQEPPPSQSDQSTDDTPDPPQPAPHEGSHDEPADEDNTPRQSLRRARMAEKVGYNELVQTKRNGGSIEDIRKANQIYITSRNNRHKAERDFKEWQRDEGILLFFDEAKDIASRPHIASKQMLEVMPKTLAPRLYNQPQKAIEATLAAWCDTLTEVIRKGI